MKRTHRLMLVLNFAVSFQDNDSIEYMEYDQLKLFLTRKELMHLYARLKAGDNYATFCNSTINQVVGV